MAEADAARCGFIALVGRPNAGKSTLLNRLLGFKLSITSPRPQTTRHVIRGIRTAGDVQLVFVDTPGLHRNARKAINRYMNRAASGALEGVDAVVLVAEAGGWTEDDEEVLRRVESAQAPVFLVLNKIDRLSERDKLLPEIERHAQRYQFAAIVPLSALDGENVAELERELVAAMPRGAHLFADDQVTDRGLRFLAAELVREKLTRRLGQELPYALTVEIEGYEQDEALTRISALIWVERESQKAIVIGRGGQALKAVGQAARRSLEAMLGSQVHLKLWVKVRAGWSDDERAIRALGYDEY